MNNNNNSSYQLIRKITKINIAPFDACNHNVFVCVVSKYSFIVYTHRQMHQCLITIFNCTLRLLRFQSSLR